MAAGVCGCRGDALEALIDDSGTGTGSTPAGSTLIDPELSWSESECTVTYGASGNTFPTLNNEYKVSVTYTSGDESVATIASDGTVTLIAAGTTTITASSEEDGTYEADSASYTLTVNKGKTGLAWSASACAATIGAEDNVFPTLSNPNGLEISYSSSNENVATISSDGAVSLVAAGSTAITATSKADGGFDSESVFYTLTVIDASSSLEDPGLSWSSDSYSVTIGDACDFPTLNNPNGLGISYSSSNAAVAEISQDGEITIITSGTTIITAASEATEVYTAGSASYTLTVSKADAPLSWSESSCTAVLDEDNTFPTLINGAGVSVTYSSSNTGVATIDSQGTIKLSAAGTTVITAAFAGDDSHNPSSASYTLTVTGGNDPGAGTFTYPSTGDSSSADDISGTTFTRKITVTYSTGGSASVTGDYYGYVTVSGNDVTVNNTGDECIVYELLGTTTDGFFKLYSSRKQAILLNGVSITNKSGAAINNQSGKRTFVMIEGTNRLADGSSYTDTPSGEDEKACFFSEGQLILSGSGSLTVTASGKAGITSDDYIRVMNSPTLNVSSSAGHGLRGKDAVQVDAGSVTSKVSAAMKKGISSDSLVVFNGGVTTVTVSGGTAYDSDDGEYNGSAGVKADKLFIMNAGTLTITNTGAGGKGISVGTDDATKTPTALFNGGTVSVTVSGKESNGVSPKGIKVGNKFLKSGYSSSSQSAKAYNYTGVLNFTGSTVVVTASGDEAIECKGVINMSGGDVCARSSSDDAINSSSTFTISGGYMAGISSGNDGIDANGNMTISGGVVMAASTSGAECGIDVNSEDQFKLTFTGGTLFVQGGLEKGSTLSQSCYSTSSISKNTWYGMTVGNTVYAFKTANTSGTPLVVSASSTPTLKSGVTVSGGTLRLDGICLTDCSISGGSSVSLSSYTSGSSGDGGGGGGGGGGNPGGGGSHLPR